MFRTTKLTQRWLTKIHSADGIKYSKQTWQVSYKSSTSAKHWDSPTQELIHQTHNYFSNFLKQAKLHKLFSSSVIKNIELQQNDLEKPFSIGFVGQWNKGKSSLINSIIGQKICKVDDLPATTQPTLYFHPSNENQQEWIDTNSENETKSIRKSGLTVEAIDLTQFKGLGIVDLPGLNSDASYGHDEIVKDILPRMDQICLVTDVHQVWSQSERITLEYLQSIGKDSGMIAIINKADHYKDDQQQSLNKLKNYLSGMLHSDQKSSINNNNNNNSNNNENIGNDDDEKYDIFLISAINAGKYDWDKLIDFLHNMHKNWLLRDTRKIDTSLTFLLNITKQELNVLNNKNDVLSSDKSCIDNCLTKFDNIANLDNSMLVSMKDLMVGRFSRIIDEVETYLSHNISIYEKLKYMHMDQKRLHLLVMDSIRSTAQKYNRVNDSNGTNTSDSNSNTNTNSVSATINPFLDNLNIKIEYVLKEIINDLNNRKFMIFDSSYESGINDMDDMSETSLVDVHSSHTIELIHQIGHKLTKIRENKLQNCVNELKTIKLNIDYVEIDSKIEKIISNTQKELFAGEAVGTVATILTAALASSFWAMIPAALTVGFAYNQINQRLSQRVSGDLDKFVKTLGNNELETVIEIIQQGLKQAQKDVNVAVSPLSQWNDESLVTIEQKLSFLTKLNTETVSFHKEMMKKCAK